jgi:hypothetical protein
MGKLEELMKSRGGNIAESIGQGGGASRSSWPVVRNPGEIKGSNG